MVLVSAKDISILDMHRRKVRSNAKAFLGINILASMALTVFCFERCENSPIYRKNMFVDVSSPSLGGFD